MPLVRGASSSATLSSNTFTGSQTITGGTVTASTPVINATQTWNNAGVAFKGFVFNTTQTASDSASRIFEWQQNGTAVCYLGRSGALFINQALACAGFACADTNSMKVDSIANGAASCGSTFTMSWTSGNYGATKDTGFARNAAGQVRVTNGSTGYGGIKCGTGASTVILETNATGIGAFAATPVAQQSVGAAATDAATTQTLANNLRTALVNFGLCTT